MPSNRETIDRIKERLDIVHVVEKYVKLKKMGKNFGGLCPFHNEKTPSFMVSPDIQRYKCFGCGKSGDIFNFVQELEGLDFPEALKKLGNEAGVEVKFNQKPSKYQKLEELNDSAAKIFQKNLFSEKGKKAFKYAKDRGLSEESVKEFRIGYAVGNNQIIKALGKSYSKEELKKSGLFTEKNGNLRDRFINRFMFPILSTSGRVIAFSGRQMPGDDFGPKYLNTPETPIFHKRKTVFGLYHSKNEIRKADLAVLCEGQMDVISAHSVDIKNIVAPLGTAITEDQIERISRYSKNILLFFDRDEAGIKAVERAFKIASPMKLNLYNSVAPKPHTDIDELIQDNPKKAKKLINRNKDAFSYLVSEKLKPLDITKMSDREEFINYVEKLLESVPEKQKLEFYLKKVNKLSGIQIGIDRESKDDDKPEKKSSGGDGSQPSQHYNIEELYLLKSLVHSNQVEKLRKMEMKYFQDKTIKKLIELLKEDDSSIRKIMEDKETSDEIRVLIEKIEFDNSDIGKDADLDELNRVYLRIKKRYFEKVRAILRQKQAIAEESGKSKEADSHNKKIMSVTERIVKIEEQLARQ